MTSPPTFSAGEWVENRWSFGTERIGRVQARVSEEYDAYYVTAGVGMTYIAQARDLRSAPTPDPLPAWTFA